MLGKLGQSSYHLNLLIQWRIHDVFPVSMLEPYREPQHPTRRLIPPTPGMVEEEENCIVIEVIDSRTTGRKNKVQYRILWEGYHSEKGTWERWESRKETSEKAIRAFQLRLHWRLKDQRVRM